ncbi:ribonucleoside-diphosphate reductase subunit alpha [Bacillus sp. NTK071]|uniref:ribonucleoside-diphosphate reductase subunit alpha n=1 Tax=Bacillus sp. NTK071 TaxID=2802175 RepID=UPI001A8D9C3B|nr:ribonucleoside-diphosphate reductase subunit alpha [Bacillus sp. NTK071]MBN8209984.1 ribonucleoside-diphosphate reductase subunit alpha [Bacillus sp. NTK071]
MSTIVEFTKGDLLNEAKTIIEGYPMLSGESFIEKTMASVTERSTQDDIANILILNALERITAEEPDWTYIAAAFHLQSIYRAALSNRCESRAYGKGSFYRLLQKLTEEGIYTKELLRSYSQQEIEEAEALIIPSRDRLFTYIGLRTLADRYLATDHNKNHYELPQERFLVIALTLMMNEPKDKRANLISEAYWALSNLYMTVATPTLSNAGKSYGQLSSCFIDTVDDSLRGIYDSNTDVATVSKNGGGIGAYLGKIRSRGSDIKGFKGNSSGVLPWMKQLNNTAVSVDQLGQRQGAVAVYLDVWHKDVLDFLDAKLNNGDERMRTHDLFTGLCIPDIFMEAVENRADWHLFDPHEVRQIMGFSLEDVYDKEKGAGEFRMKYAECVNHPELSRKTVPAIEIMKRVMKSQLETGTPYMFYRDTVNRANPNKHAGMIYASNLCTEIMQNMSATTVEEEITKDGKIIITKTPGDYVVCNLSSINLGRAVTANVLKRLIPIQVRMLDNVIDINTIEVPQAQLTNEKYRSIGLGTFGWHHLLAKKGIVWESHEAANYADELYETINYLTIQASYELAVEKGSYSLFEGSDWQNGEYFHHRGYASEKWQSLREKVQADGVRNAYLLAVAPNSSTSLIAGSTASIDPIFQKEYSEEKKNYKIPVTAPDLSPDTTWYYKSAYHINQLWSIEQNAARQRHVDQSISFNIYVQSTVKAKDLLNLHMTAWRKGLKTTYYTRSTSVDIDDCESCAS